MQAYPKRLIEVDLPIKRISIHARREKNIHHGHISSLHIWWARRPLAACRAVICASLWPDPADNLCPESFREVARNLMRDWASQHLEKVGPESFPHFVEIQKNYSRLKDNIELRKALLNFIADFSNWNNSNDVDYLRISRALTQNAHEALGGQPGTRPLVVDPFAGGGAIPIEALRVGADVFASDLNPLPVLLNKVILEYIPKYGMHLANEVEKLGAWIKTEAEKELLGFYPRATDGAIPIAYLWARTIKCEGPGCGAELPLIRTNALYKKGKTHWYLKPKINTTRKTIHFEIDKKAPAFSTIKSGTVTCPICGYTTANKQVMAQVVAKNGGADSAVLLVTISESPKSGKQYGVPAKSDYPAKQIESALQRLGTSGIRAPSVKINPRRPSPNARGLSAVTRYGMSEFRHLYSRRQTVTLLTIRRLVSEATSKAPPELKSAVGACLLLAFGRLIDRNSTLCRWIPQTGGVGYTFGRQALSMIWDFVEINPLSHSGGWSGAVEDIVYTIRNNECLSHPGTTEQLSATEHSLPNDIVSALITDPPYYDAIPYADLSDFFYVWLRPLLKEHFSELADDETTPKEQEAIWNPGRLLQDGRPKDEKFYENQMQKALSEARRITAPTGIAVIVFAHKSTAGWEALLNGMLQAGWIVQASWPIDTEREARTNAIDTASLASSVHLVCRPRKTSDSSNQTDDVGDWRDVLQALPSRIHDWMPRLADEGIVGADAIFACLGPALEIYSRYSRVEKASGESVSLKEYLEQVWAAVAKEALKIIIPDADTSGFEEDARLTAMWLWTVTAGKEAATNSESTTEYKPDDEPESEVKNVKIKGFILEYDAARKIAQGLGVHLEDMRSLVEVSGDKARLLPVSERARALFGKDEGKVTKEHKKTESQADLFAALEQGNEVKPNVSEIKIERQGETVLDRIHQSMILFAAGRGEALKRFLVEDGVGRDQRFWRLAQALSALYPSQTDEKRWVDGMLARKKGLGF